MHLVGAGYQAAVVELEACVELISVRRQAGRQSGNQAGTREQEERWVDGPPAVLQVAWQRQW